MKATGIVRKIDELGRIVIPKELRKTMNIDIKDPLEVFVDGELVVLKKYEPSRIFCGEAKGVRNIKGKNICTTCLEEINQTK